MEIKGIYYCDVCNKPTIPDKPICSEKCFNTIEISILRRKRNEISRKIAALKRANLKMGCISCGKLFTENGYLECDECLEKNALKKATFGG